MKKILLFLIPLLIFNCNSDDDSNGPTQNCTDVFVYGLVVTLKDANTDSFVTSGVTVVAKDGEYEEELIQAEDLNFFQGAGEREGSYIIEVTSSDYEPFTSNVVVLEKTEDNCHVITQQLEFVLQPN